MLPGIKWTGLKIVLKVELLRGHLNFLTLTYLIFGSFCRYSSDSQQDDDKQPMYTQFEEKRLFCEMKLSNFVFKLNRENISEDGQYMNI